MYDSFLCNFKRYFFIFFIVFLFIDSTALASEKILLAIKGNDFCRTVSKDENAFNFTGDNTCMYIESPVYGIQIVPNESWKRGGCFFIPKLSFDKQGEDSGFSVAFSVYLGDSTDIPADGFAFAITKDKTSIGESGEGMGYLGINNSVGIEFDTFQNKKNETDPNEDEVPHVTLRKNGSTEFLKEQKLEGWGTLKNSTVYCWIDYKYSARDLEIRFSKNNIRPESETLKYNIDIPEEIGSDSFHIGITSSTGKYSQQVILSSQFYREKYGPIEFTKDYESDLKLYYKINYNLDGGVNSTLNPNFYNEERISLNPPTKVGYKFEGWYDNPEFSGDPISEIDSQFTGDKTFYAKWSDQTINLDIIDNTIYVIYDGTEKKPSVVVKDGDKILVENIDYLVSYLNNVNVGIANVKITGIGNYKDTIEKTFVIESKNLRDEDINVSIIESVIYNSTEHTPSLIVRDGSRLLVENIDYLVSYLDNIDSGIANVKINGIGNYKGLIEKNFVIEPKSLKGEDISVSVTESVIYNSKEHTPSLIVRDGSRLLVENTDYLVSYLNNVDAGISSIKITGIGNYKDIVEKTFVIEPKSLKDEDISVSITESVVGNSTRYTPQVVVKDGSKLLVENIDYLLSYLDNADAGISNIKITGIGNYKDSINETFTTDKFDEFAIDTSYWGDLLINGGQRNWVSYDGTTSAMIKDYGMTWLKEDSDGSYAWYGIDNSSGAFELGSRFWVRWISEEKDPLIWKVYYDKLDDEHKFLVENNKLWIFLVGVTAPDGTEYHILNANVPFYIQLGSDWDKDDINALFIADDSDEIINLTYLDSMKYPEGDGKFVKVILKHFSPYAIYDKLDVENLAVLAPYASNDTRENHGDQKTGEHVFSQLASFVVVVSLGLLFKNRY